MSTPLQIVINHFENSTKMQVLQIIGIVGIAIGFYLIGWARGHQRARLTNTNK